MSGRRPDVSTVSRWPLSPRERLRRRRQRLALVVVLAGAAGAGWWRARPSAPSTGDTFAGMPTTIDPPGIYGIMTAPLPLGGGRNGTLVDRPDSAAPLVLLIVEAVTPPPVWAGVQALLDREGIASVVVREEAADDGVSAVRAMARRRSQPWNVLVAGTALRALGASGTDIRAVVLDPPTPARGGWRAWLPGFVTRRFGAADDDRLADRRAEVLVVDLADGGRSTGTDASRLAAGAPHARVVSLPGATLTGVLPHPDPDQWRGVIDFLRGVVVPGREVVVPFTPDSAGDALPSAATSATPPATTPPPRP